MPGTLKLGEGVLNPGDRVEVDFELGRPIAVEPGMRFAMREGGRTASRLEKAIVHELGHTYQAPHCPERDCVMRQVQSLSQLDELPADLCPSCETRIANVANRGVHHPDGLIELAGSYLRRRRYGRAIAAYSAACAALGIEDEVPIPALAR